MKDSEIILLVDIAMSSSPYSQNKSPAMIANAWKLMLADIPFPIAQAAVIKVCRASKFFPSIAEIVAAAEELDPRNEHLPTAAEAWEEVNKAIRYVGPYRAPKLSCETVERATKAIGWVRLCESDNPEADRAHFLRIYESMRSKHHETKEFNKAIELSGMKDIIMALAGGMGVNQIVGKAQTKSIDRPPKGEQPAEKKEWRKRNAEQN